MKNKNRFLAVRLLLFWVVTCLCPPAFAAAADDNAATPRLRLAAESSRWAAHDRVRITLGAQAQAGQQADVAEQLNRAVNAVLARGAEAQGIEARSGPYSVWQQSGSAKSASGGAQSWQGHAQVIITAADFEAASRFAASVQAHMAIQQLQFALSEQAQNRLRQQLLAEAATAFRAKAREASAAFGFGGYRIARIELEDGGQMGGGMLARSHMLETVSATAPTLEGGREKVTVRVSGDILLLDDNKEDGARVPLPSNRTENRTEGE